MSREGRGFHRTDMIMVLLLSGLSSLFLGVSAAYLFHRFSTDAAAPFPPLIFLINIPILLYANRMLRVARKSFRWTPKEALVRRLGMALTFTMIFAVLQAVGWWQYLKAGQTLQSSIPTSYLYVLSGLHLLHVIGGIPFLVSYLLKTHSATGPDLRNPKRYRYLKGLSLYWDFVDILWILLVALLVVSALFP